MRKLPFYKTFTTEYLKIGIKHWIKDHTFEIAKASLIFSLVFIGVYIANKVPTIKEVVASGVGMYQEFLDQKALREAEELERQAEETMRAIREDELAELRRQEQILKDIQRVNDIEDEIESEFAINDKILITWWGTDYGAIAPTGNNSAGKITKIIGEHIRGTWGDYELTWNSCAFRKCTAREMREALKNDELRKAKEIKSKTKKWATEMSADEKRIFRDKGIVFNVVN